MSRREANAINGARRLVFSGLRSVGQIAEINGSWKAITIGGRTVGYYGSAAEASRAVTDAHRNAEVIQ